MVRKADIDITLAVIIAVVTLGILLILIIGLRSGGFDIISGIKDLFNSLSLS